MDGDVSSEVMALGDWCEACVGIFHIYSGEDCTPTHSRGNRQEVKFVVMIVGFECHTLAQPFFFVVVFLISVLWSPQLCGHQSA